MRLQFETLVATAAARDSGGEPATRAWCEGGTSVGGAIYATYAVAWVEYKY